MEQRPCGSATGSYKYSATPVGRPSPTTRPSLLRSRLPAAFCGPAPSTALVSATMSSSFAALMALSASQTQQSQSAVQSALADRQRKEEQRKKQQEEKERKEREVEAQIRKRRLEEDKREQERRERLDRERQAKERERERREQEQRDHLLGQKKRRVDYPASASASTSASTSGSSGEGRRRREDDDSPAVALTREEKRERKLQADLRRELGARSGRSMASHQGYGKTNRRLPGGAIDVMATQASSLSGDSSTSQQSARARIAAMPNTLTKLNPVKRDTRTIDEILQDRAKAREVKILDGDQAREFNDWFGTKKKETPKPASPPKSGTNSPAPVASSSSECASQPKSLSVAESSQNLPQPHLRRSLFSRHQSPLQPHLVPALRPFPSRPPLRARPPPPIRRSPSPSLPPHPPANRPSPAPTKPAPRRPPAPRPQAARRPRSARARATRTSPRTRTRSTSAGRSRAGSAGARRRRARLRPRSASRSGSCSGRTRSSTSSAT